jgi:branched-chain amino acid transport system substrate-binding protein
MKKLILLTLLTVFFWIFGIISFAVAEEGVTDTEIHLGQWGPQTGPAAAWGSIQRGTDAYFKMINANGGIHGRKIVYHMFDDGYNPAKTKAGVKELQEGVGIFAWASGVGTAPGLAVKDYLMKRKVPWIGPASGSSHWVNPPQKYLFTVYPLYTMEAKILTKYAIETLRKKRIAIAYQNDDYGKGGLKGAIEELKKHGLKLVAKVPVELKDTDMKPHVMKLKKAKAEVVLLWTSVSHAVRLIGVSKAMRFVPQFMSTSTCSDFPLMMHISKGLWEDVITASFGEFPDSNNALLKKYKKEVYKKYAAKSERWGVFFYAGIMFVEPLVEAMNQCGRDLTRERLVEKLEGLKNFKGIGPVISYKPFNPKDPMCRQGSKATFLVKCMKDGKSNRLTDWISMD